MNKKFWFSAPSEEEGPEWTGLIEHPDVPGSPYKINLVRNTKDDRDLIKSHKKRAHFSDGFINGYIGMQKKGALLQCRQTKFNDLEVLQLGNDRKTLAFNGEATFLLEGAWLAHETESYYKSFTASFQGLEAVLDHSFKFPDDPITTETVFSYCPHRDWEIHCSETGDYSWSANKHASYRKLELRVVFGNPMNAYPHMHLYRSLCQLFDLLSGRAFKPIKAHLSTKAEREFHSPSLTYAAHYFEHVDSIFSAFCTLDSTDVLTAMERLLSIDTNFLVSDLAVIFRIHFEKGYIEEKLFWGIPVLEQQLKRNCQTQEETSYRALETRFFREVEEKLDRDLVEFSKKHLQVTERKTRGLKQQATEVINLFRSHDFPVPTEFAEALRDTRAQLMHGSLDERKLKMPLDEIERVNRFLCIALFFKELGVPIEKMVGLGECFFPSMRRNE